MHGSAIVHAGFAPAVNVGVSGVPQAPHAVPFQQLLLLARRIDTLSVATPEPASSAVPQMSATPGVPQPARQAAPLP